jgi:hypothetical protein
VGGPCCVKCPRCGGGEVTPLCREFGFVCGSKSCGVAFFILEGGYPIIALQHVPLIGLERAKAFLLKLIAAHRAFEERLQEQIAARRARDIEGN